METKALVVGIGNPIRQDDGIGPYCVEKMRYTYGTEERKPVDYLVVHQLDIIHCDILARYQLIVFIDADALKGDEPFRVERMKPEAKHHPFTTHIGSISDLLSLVQQLHQVEPTAYLVAVKGDSFEVGEGLSPQAVENAKYAVGAANRLIDTYLQTG